VNARTTAWLTLFASVGTLVCCALPFLLVTLGFGAAVAALGASAPFLITLSEHKEWLFLVSGVMLLAAAWLAFRPELPCPADPALQRLCAGTRTWNRRVFWLSVFVWGSGFFAAYLLLPLWQWLDA
jgi:mercuric ion transport protein